MGHAGKTTAKESRKPSKNHRGSGIEMVSGSSCSPSSVQSLRS